MCCECTGVQRTSLCFLAIGRKGLESKRPSALSMASFYTFAGNENSRHPGARGIALTPICRLGLATPRGL